MRKERLFRYSQMLAEHADRSWVTIVFFLIFFADSFLMLIPCDSLLGTSVALRPRHAKKWFVASSLGAIVALALIVFLSNTLLNGYLHERVAQKAMYAQVADILDHASQYGFAELTLGTFTVVPCVIGAITAAMVGLNPWAVFGIVVAAKLFRIVLAMWLIHSSSSVVKRWVRAYLKIPS